MPREVIQPVTWEWVEREIARQIASRPHGRQRAKVFYQLLAKGLRTTSAPKKRRQASTFKEQ